MDRYSKQALTQGVNDVQVLAEADDSSSSRASPGWRSGCFPQVLGKRREICFSWEEFLGGGVRGKEAIGDWLRRFHKAALKIEEHEIVVGGFPWDTTVCIRITDHSTDSGGRIVYENRAVLFGKVRWGKIVFYEVYKDTEKVKALDEYLEKLEVRAIGST